jgi:hypothetical protein
MSEPMVIYVAGPYSGRTTAEINEHIRDAIRAGDNIRRKGHAPLIPHLNKLYGDWHIAQWGHDLTQEEYLKWDFQLLRKCDGMLFLAPSPGANRELAFANLHGIPVYDSVDRLPEVTK